MISETICTNAVLADHQDFTFLLFYYNPVVVAKAHLVAHIGFHIGLHKDEFGQTLAIIDTVLIIAQSLERGQSLFVVGFFKQLHSCLVFRFQFVLCAGVHPNGRTNTDTGSVNLFAQVGHLLLITIASSGKVIGAIVGIPQPPVLQFMNCALTDGIFAEQAILKQIKVQACLRHAQQSHIVTGIVRTIGLGCIQKQRFLLCIIKGFPIEIIVQPSAQGGFCPAGGGILLIVGLAIQALLAQQQLAAVIVIKHHPSNVFCAVGGDRILLIAAPVDDVTRLRFFDLL